MFLSTRVAICGAGPSGLSQLHAFESARQCGLQIPEIVCFEKQNDLGGQWNYTWRTGFDEYSEPVHSSMYQNLWTNLPKESSEFVDYSFDKHFGQAFTSFPPRTMIYDYIRGYAEQNNVRQYIQFNTVVRWISYSEDTKRFNVLVKDLKKDEMRSEEFDYVIVATGHFSTPDIPYFNGIETFPGRILHSHDFRFAHDFADKHVLIIGSGASAEDIALQLYKYGAKSATLSYRTKPLGFKWPDGIKEVPLVVKIDKETAYFKDGSSQEVHAIIFCTGYIYHFPFLDDNLRLKSPPRSLYPPGLYKGMFWLNQPRLLYLGMQRSTFSFNIGNVQTWYARDVILEKIILPSTKDEMQCNMALWQEKGKSVQNLSDYVHFQKEYILDLIAATDYPRFDIDRMSNTFLECIKSRTENMLTYREKTYASVLTNTIAKQHHVPWLNEMDDRLENFIKK
jgi:trimethylamine monooxygenase